MIYLKHIEEVQRLCIPKLRDVMSHGLTFAFQNSSYRGECSIVGCETNSRYYNLWVILPMGIMPGEYSYSFRDSMGELSSGVFVVDDQIEQSSAARNINNTNSHYLEYHSEFSRIIYEDSWVCLQYDPQKQIYEELIASDGKKLLAMGEMLYVRQVI